jgi:hypothetical protein
MCALILCSLALLAGCGGGGGGPAPAEDPWPAYSPPDNVVSQEQREEYVGSQALGTLQALVEAPDDQWIFPYGRIPALANMGVGALYPALENIIGSLSVAPAPQQPSLSMMFLRVLQETSRPRQVEERMQTQDAIDWTDPETGVHWTGIVELQTTSLVVDLHGAGTNTNIDLDLTGSPILNGTDVVGATVTGTISGQILAEVDVINWTTGERTTVPGRATLDGDVDGEGHWTDLSAGTFSIDSLHMLADFETNSGGGWQLRDRQELEGSGGGSWDTEKVTANLTLNAHDGTTTSDGNLFWCEHDLTANLQVMRADYSFSGTLHDDLAFSNGMSGYLDITAPAGLSSGTVDGKIYDTNGTTVIATITGSLDPSAADPNKLSISWYGGPPQVLDWYYP